MKKTFLTITVLLFIFALAESASAIGQMTKPIEIKDVLRGQEIFDTLTFFNSEDKEVVYDIKTDGQIASWASFYKSEDKDFKTPITQVNMPAKSQVIVVVKFLVPSDAPNGTYLGQIAVMTKAGTVENTEGASVNVLETIGRSVSITVTDKEIINFDVSIIPSKYGIGRGEALKIKTEYYNNGNVSMRPDVQLTIKKGESTVFNAIFPYPESEGPVGIKSRKVLSYIEWQSGSSESGKYTANVKILHNGNVITEKNFKFSIGYFSSNNVWISAISFLGGGNVTLGWIVAGVILLIVLALANVLLKKGLNFEKLKIVFGNIRKLF